MTRQDKERPPLNPPEIIPDRIIPPDNTIWVVSDHEVFSNPKHYVKAGKTRPWWNPYFYNCLPIVMGNQHGFLMLSTYDFLIRWNGKNDLPDLEVQTLETPGPLDPIIIESHFGSGILTVQSRHSLRTPPGVNLMVKEPPNFYIDGISWMNAVVETDNLRRDFTYNLKVTRPHVDIFVPKGTPVGCILPYPRYFLDQYKMEDLKDPELLQEARKAVDYFAQERDQHDKGIPRKRYMEGIDVFNLRFKHHQKSLDMGKWWHSGVEDAADRLPEASNSRLQPQPVDQADVPAFMDAMSGAVQDSRPAGDAPKKCPVAFMHSAFPKPESAHAADDKGVSRQQDELTNQQTQATSPSNGHSGSKESGKNGQAKQPWWQSILNKLINRGNSAENLEQQTIEVDNVLSVDPFAPVTLSVSRAPAVSYQLPQAEVVKPSEESPLPNPSQELPMSQPNVAFWAEHTDKYSEFKEIVELNSELPDKTVMLYLPPSFDKSLIPVKAERLRNWWEKDRKTIDHARFCLPLTMASSVGWYILSPATFTVEWDGDEEHDAEIDILDASSHAAIDTHSAHGSFTVQTQFVPRTKRPGDYIYVKGVANQRRQMYSLLEGMVEAWWSPGNFGMVCMMNGPGKVRVEKGQPFAQMLVVNAEQCLYDLQHQDGWPARYQEWDRKRDPATYNGRNLDYFRGLWPDGKAVCPHFKQWTQAGPIEGVDAAEDYPMFDRAIDGPLLESAVTMELDTDAGKIHLILEPDLAPITATQLHKLLKHGAFTGTPLTRYEPDFLIQTAVAEEKTGGRAPMTSKIKSMMRRLPLEVEAQKNGSIKHRKWCIGMGRDDDPDSAVSSFSMFLGDAPHLNEHYTIFGRVVPNQATMATIEKMKDQIFNGKYPTINSAREI